MLILKHLETLQHQERETEIFTAYGILLLWWVGRRWAVALHYVYTMGKILPETCWADLIDQ